MPTPPNQTYYLACVGQWSCAFDAEVHDFGELRAAIGFVNALGLLLISRWPAVRLTTTVSVESPTLVVHTTKVSWFGLPLVWSREDLVLDEDGQSFQMTSTMRSLPLPWVVERVEGPGSVADDTRSATYHIDMYGAQKLQTTRRSANQVTLEQVLPGYRAEHPLERVAR